MSMVPYSIRRPGMGMVLGVSAGIVNILLDYIFMVPFHMGIKGGGIWYGHWLYDTGGDWIMVLFRKSGILFLFLN